MEQPFACTHISTNNGAQDMLQVMSLGRINYAEALDFQKKRVASRRADKVGDTLLLLEHTPVITMGRSGENEHLQVSKEFLRKQGVELFWVERGGMATYHGPGQLVGYPIIKLKEKDLHLYLEKLLNAVAATVAHYGLEVQRSVNGPGIWVNGAKIASVGIAVRQWVTFHGMALNVNTDMEGFRLITPCGNPQERIASLKEILGYHMDFAEVSRVFAHAFAQEFGTAITSDSAIASEQAEKGAQRPAWLTVTLPPSHALHTMQNVESTLDTLQLHTVCQEAMCPNKGECYARGTATFIIMGDVCTRTCRYCAVGKGTPAPLDAAEPMHVAEAVRHMGLKHAVITSVTRDDIVDGGAEHFVQTIQAVRRLSPSTSVEVLVPDFQGRQESLESVCNAAPDVFNHNIETVARLFPRVRPRASYMTSLQVLAYAAKKGLRVKSGIMLGLGETWEEVRATLHDLYTHGCRFLTLGQYLAPSQKHVSIARYVAEDEFDHWKDVALAMGFEGVASAPLVRSSYRAEAMLAGSDCAHHQQ